MSARRIKGEGCTVRIEGLEQEFKVVEFTWNDSSIEESPIMSLPHEGYSFSMEATIVVSGRWYRGIRIHGHQTQIEKECAAFDKTLSDDIRRRFHMPPYERYGFNPRSWFTRWS